MGRLRQGDLQARNPGRADDSMARARDVIRHSALHATVGELELMMYPPTVGSGFEPHVAATGVAPDSVPEPNFFARAEDFLGQAAIPYTPGSTPAGTNALIFLGIPRLPVCVGIHFVTAMTNS